MRRQDFENVTDYLAFVESPVDADCEELGRSSHDRGNWYGVQTWDAALHYAHKGWPEGRERIEKMRTVIESTIEGEIPVLEPHYDVSPGDWLDIGRYVSGEPECFGELIDSGVKRDAPVAKIVHVVVNQCVSASQSTEAIFYRGAAIVAIVDILERRGIRCEIDLLAANRSAEGFQTKIRLKEAQDSLQLDKLAFLIANAASFRRLCFSAWEHFDRDFRRKAGITAYGGYGYVDEAIASERGDIYLPGFESAFEWGEKAVITWVKSQLSKFGINFEA